MKQAEILEQGRPIGEEFLIWLWMRGLTDGGTSGVEGDQTALFVDDQVQLVTEHGDVKQMSLGKGNPAESREAFEALAHGMRPTKFKIRLLAGDMEWTGTLDAVTLSFSSLKLPPCQCKDPQGRMADRMFMVEEATGHLDRRYGAFLVLRSGHPAGLEIQLKEWIEQGLAGMGMPEVVPWEG